MKEAENNQNQTPIQNKEYQGRRKSISKKKKIDSFVCRLSLFLDCKKLNKLVKKFEEDFKKKDLVRNDENDDTTGTTNDKNDLLHFDSKMESDSPASDDDNQKSDDDDDDGKQDVVMDEVDEQNKEDVCKESCSIHENKCVAIRLTFKSRAWRKKSVMDNENKDAETVELSSSIKRCGHPMKHSYNLDVKDVNEPIAEKINNEDQDAEETPFEFADRKDEQTVQNADTLKNVNEKCTSEESTNVEQADTQVETTEIINECHIDVDSSKNEIETNTGDQTVEHNDANEDTGNTNSAFVDIRDDQNNDDYDLSNNADAKSEKEDEEFDALAITICNVCHPVPLQIINVEDSESKKEEFDFGGDTDNEEKYDSKKDVDYKGEFCKSPYELKPIEPKIYVSASEKLFADTLFAMIYKPREIVFETYEGFKVLAIEMETLATGLDVHYEVINAWCDVLNTIEKYRKDYDKPVRKYCFKTGFLQANFLDKNVDANMKVKNFEKKLKEAVNNDTTLIKLQQIQFHFYVICIDLQSGSFVLIENNCVENDSADRDLGIPKALYFVFVDFMQSIEYRSYKKLRRAKLEVVKLDFKKRNDHADCGIIVMTAMDCYIGEVKKLKEMFLEGIPYTQLVNLRQMIATKIMMTKINIRKNVYQRRIKSKSKKKIIDSFVCNDYDDYIDEVDPNIIMKEVFTDINKSSVEYIEDNSNDEDNEHSHSAEEEQNTEDSDSVKTRPVKKCGHPKKIVRANENKSSSVKRRGRPRKNYFPSSPGNISPESSNDLPEYRLTSLAISPYNNDLYIIQVYDAILPPQAIIALPTVLPLSPVLSLPPMFNSLDFFSSEKISPSKDIETPVKSLILVSPSSLVGSSSPVRSTTSPPDYPFDELSKWSRYETTGK
nr:hypothetical protein [Tanacetum cinerariifolium]